MDDVGWVHEEESSEDLIDEILDVVVAEFLSGIDDPMQIGFHEVSDDVDVIIVGACFWAKDVEQSDDVVVLEKLWNERKVTE